MKGCFFINLPSFGKELKFIHKSIYLILLICPVFQYLGHVIQIDLTLIFGNSINNTFGTCL